MSGRGQAPNSPMRAQSTFQSILTAWLASWAESKQSREAAYPDAKKAHGMSSMHPRMNNIHSSPAIQAAEHPMALNGRRASACSFQ